MLPRYETGALIFRDHYSCLVSFPSPSTQVIGGSSQGPGRTQRDLKFVSLRIDLNKSLVLPGKPVPEGSGGCKQTLVQHCVEVKLSFQSDFVLFLLVRDQLREHCLKAFSLDYLSSHGLSLKASLGINYVEAQIVKGISLLIRLTLWGELG